MLYAIVDIETTGSYAMGNGITEVAIVVHDGKEVLDFYETLVNPGRPIPYFIQNLTGINDRMVATAPAFEQVAAKVFEMLQDKVFVAHNVNFDYSFLKHHLQEAGYNLETRKLCTVRLSRKIMPGLQGYSLGKLCHQLKVNLTNHHRAGGDALATAEIFSMLVAKDEKNVIAGMLKGRNREQYLPPHLPVEQLDNLPSSPGVYYFYNVKGKVVYVGKAVNILKRVKSHFSNNKPNKQKQDFLREIHRISYKECATELMAHILESSEIRKLWPVYNRSQRGYLPRFGLFVYEDRQGFKRFVVEKARQHFKPLFTFNTIAEGHQWLRELISEFDLCPRLCCLAKLADCAGTTNERGDCEVHADATAYNERVALAMEWIAKHLPTFAYLDKGIDDNEESCILIKGGNLYGMGYIYNRDSLKNIKLLEQQLEPMQDNDFVRNLIYKHAARFPEKRIELEPRFT
jgi:DNA polymerase-3 subunit epsilon